MIWWFDALKCQFCIKVGQCWCFSLFVFWQTALLTLFSCFEESMLCWVSAISVLSWCPNIFGKIWCFSKFMLCWDSKMLVLFNSNYWWYYFDALVCQCYFEIGKTRCYYMPNIFFKWFDDLKCQFCGLVNVGVFICLFFGKQHCWHYFHASKNRCYVEYLQFQC